MTDEEEKHCRSVAIGFYIKATTGEHEEWINGADASVCSIDQDVQDLAKLIRKERLETARACAEECEGLAGKAQLEADSQISWYESQRPEACAAAAKLCASAIRARFGIKE